MSVNDQISDILSRLMNAAPRKKEEVVVPYTKLGKAVAEVLVSEKYLRGVALSGENGKQRLVLKLGYSDAAPSITGVKRISKPGVRIYTEADKIPKVLSGKGIVILSTSGGVMSGREAKKKRLGGEILCKIW